MPQYPPQVEQWRALVSQYFPPEMVDKALHVILYESGGNPNAFNPSGATGLFQVQGKTNFANRPWTVEELKNPALNVQVAAQMAGKNWNQWTDWGEGVKYNGAPFGALGFHPYQNSGGSVSAASAPPPQPKPQQWISDPTGKSGATFDPNTGLHWDDTKGWTSDPIWVNDPTYGNTSGGFYFDPKSNQVWTQEQGWTNYKPILNPVPNPTPPKVHPVGGFGKGITVSDTNSDQPMTVEPTNYHTYVSDTNSNQPTTSAAPSPSQQPYWINSPGMNAGGGYHYDPISGLTWTNEQQGWVPLSQQQTQPQQPTINQLVGTGTSNAPQSAPATFPNPYHTGSSQSGSSSGIPFGINSSPPSFQFSQPQPVTYGGAGLGTPSGGGFGSATGLEPYGGENNALSLAGFARGTGNKPRMYPRYADGTQNLPVQGGTITQLFGATNEPLDSGGFNKGIDIGVPVGTPVSAIVPGVVVSAGPSNDGWGISVKIKDAQGNIHNYGHMSSVSVKPGDQVNVGDNIGASGNTGASTGPHLSYDVLGTGGQYIDPSPFVGFNAAGDNRKGITFGGSGMGVKADIGPNPITPPDSGAAVKDWYTRVRGGQPGSGPLSYKGFDDYFRQRGEDIIGPHPNIPFTIGNINGSPAFGNLGKKLNPFSNLSTTGKIPVTDPGNLSSSMISGNTFDERMANLYEKESQLLQQFLALNDTNDPDGTKREQIAAQISAISKSMDDLNKQRELGLYASNYDAAQSYVKTETDKQAAASKSLSDYNSQVSNLASLGKASNDFAESVSNDFAAANDYNAKRYQAINDYKISRLTPPALVGFGPNNPNFNLQDVITSMRSNIPSTAPKPYQPDLTAFDKLNEIIQQATKKTVPGGTSIPVYNPQTPFGAL